MSGHRKELRGAPKSRALGHGVLGPLLLTRLPTGRSVGWMLANNKMGVEGEIRSQATTAGHSGKITLWTHFTPICQTHNKALNNDAMFCGSCCARRPVALLGWFQLCLIEAMTKARPTASHSARARSFHAWQSTPSWHARLSKSQLFVLKLSAPCVHARNICSSKGDCAAFTSHRVAYLSSALLCSLLRMNPTNRNGLGDHKTRGYGIGTVTAATSLRHHTEK